MRHQETEIVVGLTGFERQVIARATLIGFGPVVYRWRPLKT